MSLVRRFFIYSIILLVTCTCSTHDDKRDVVIGISNVNSWDNWRKAMLEEIRREVAFYPNLIFDLRITDAEDNSDKQISDIEQMVKEGIDLLIISPNDAAPLKHILERVYDMGIPTILVDRRIDSEKYTAFVGADNEYIGREAAYLALDLLNEKGTVLEFQGTLSASAPQERSNGFRQIISKNNHVKHLPLAVKWSEEHVALVIDSLVGHNQSIDLIFAHNDKMAKAAALAASKHNLKPYIVGIDGFPDGGIQMVYERQIDATFLYPTGGEQSIQLAVKILEGLDFEKENPLYTTIIDDKNVRAVRQQGLQIAEQQAKIDRQQDRLSTTFARLERKNWFLLLSVLVISALVVLTAWGFYLLHQKSVLNAELRQNTQTIQKQHERIMDQRDKLVHMLKIAEEATETKIQFFTNLSHDFRQTLTLIKRPIDKVLADGKGSDIVADLSSVQQNIQKLARLSDEIIDFKKIEKNKYNLEFRLTNTADLVTSLIDSFQPEVSAKSISVIRTVPTSLEACLDAAAFEKIVGNLFSNSLKYTPIGGTVSVELEATSNSIELKIKDSGIGIPSTEISKIFDRYHRVSETNGHPGTAGSGLGLSIVKDLVGLHGGAIEVESEPGLGSMFKVIIPQKLPARPEAVPPVPPTTDKLRAPKILVIEDNEEIRHVLQEIIEKYYKVFTACDGVEGLQLVEQHHPHLIISDIYMPNLDGVTVCRQIKNNSSTLHIPIILLSALHSPNSMISAFDMGADAYVTKPFNEDVLLSRIHNLLESRHRIQQILVEKNALGSKSSDAQEELFIEECLHQIQRHVSDGINLDQLAEYMNMSHSSLARKIKQYTGLKAVDFLKKGKLQYASKLLLYSDLTIMEVAFQSGFNDAKYFSKCFTAEYGIRPSQFRDQGQVNTQATAL